MYLKVSDFMLPFQELDFYIGNIQSTFEDG